MNQTDGAKSVTAPDLDCDSDLNALSASDNDESIACYENLHGAGDFSGPRRVITPQADGANSVAAADLEGDINLDVRSTSFDDDKMAWNSNLDGAGNFP